jgi:hypothetical protein
VLTALISIMFIVSVASTISALRRESEEVKAFKHKHNAF